MRILVALGLAALLSPQAAAHTPHDSIQAVGVSPTFAQDTTLFSVLNLSEHRVFGRSFDGGRSWQTYGHEMVQSQVLDIALSPDFATDGVSLLGSEDSGLWRSVDRGASWRRITAGFDALTVNKIAFDSDFASTRIVAVATNSGFYISTNAGMSWTQQNTGLSNLTLAVMASHSGGPNGPVFYAGRTQLFRSDDLGLNWTALGSIGGVAKHLRLHPEFPTRPVLGAVLRASGGLHFSVDGGLSFPSAQSSLSGLTVTDLVMRSEGSMLASTADSVLHADNLGAAWLPQPLLGLDAQSSQTSIHYNLLRSAKLPDNAGEALFLAGFEGLFRSINEAQSWTSLDVYPQRVNRTIAISPNYPNDHVLALGNFGGGLVISESGGKHWESLGSGGQLAGPGGTPGGGLGSGGQVTARAGSPSSPTGPTPSGAGAVNWRTNGTDISSLWTGPVALSPTFAIDKTVMIGHGGLWVSNDRGRHWQQADYSNEVKVVRGITLSPNFAEDRVAFFGTGAFGAGSENQGIFKTTDGGATWQTSGDGLSSTANAREFAFSPGWSSDQTVFMASRNEGVWRSEDAGTNWVAVSNGLSSTALRVIRISPDFVNDRTLWVGSLLDGLFVSTDAGDNWQPRNAGIPDLAGIDIEGIALSPNIAADRTLFVSTQRAGLWKSTNYAQSWQPINDGLPLDMPRGLEISPGFRTDQTLFLSTHDWVWRSTDAGSNWSRLDGSLRVPDDHPNVIYDQEWSRETLVGAHGLGVQASPGSNNWCELEFRGNRIRWFANLEPGGGFARVFVDSVELAMIDTYAATITPQVQVFEHKFEAVDWHTIRVESTGLMNPMALDDRVNTDGFEYRF